MLPDIPTFRKSSLQPPNQRRNYLISVEVGLMIFLTSGAADQRLLGEMIKLVRADHHLPNTSQTRQSPEVSLEGVDQRRHCLIQIPSVVVMSVMIVFYHIITRREDDESLQIDGLIFERNIRSRVKLAFRRHFRFGVGGGVAGADGGSRRTAETRIMLERVVILQLARF